LLKKIFFCLKTLSNKDNLIPKTSLEINHTGYSYEHMHIQAIYAHCWSQNSKLHSYWKTNQLLWFEIHRVKEFLSRAIYSYSVSVCAFTQLPVTLSGKCLVHSHTCILNQYLVKLLISCLLSLLTAQHIRRYQKRELRRPQKADGCVVLWKRNSACKYFLVIRAFSTLSDTFQFAKRFFWWIKIVVCCNHALQGKQYYNYIFQQELKWSMENVL